MLLLGLFRSLGLLGCPPGHGQAVSIASAIDLDVDDDFEGLRMIV
jgi:hypothetical protein